MTKLQKSRAGFVIFKLRVDGAAYYLLRANSKWKDLNFLGGHEKERDGGNLEKAARRELWEEVPLLRKVESLSLEPLTDLVHYGPIHSQSQGRDMEYELQFFLLKLDNLPEGIAEMFNRRTKNVLISEVDLLNGRRFRVSGLVNLLDKIFPGGLRAISYTSSIDLGTWRDRFQNLHGSQLEFALK